MASHQLNEFNSLSECDDEICHGCLIRGEMLGAESASSLASTRADPNQPSAAISPLSLDVVCLADEQRNWTSGCPALLRKGKLRGCLLRCSAGSRLCSQHQRVQMLLRQHRRERMQRLCRCIEWSGSLPLLLLLLLSSRPQPAAC